MGGFDAAWSLGEALVRALGSTTGAAIVSWLFVGLFLVAGASKIRHPRSAAEALVNFGVVQNVRVRTGTALGTAELGLACAFGAIPALAAFVAAPLLWLFVLLVGRRLQAGYRFPCACFGDAAELLSWWSLVRTTLLALMATGLILGDLPALRAATVETLLEATTAFASLGTIVLIRGMAKLLTVSRRPLGALG